jgi:hypothetical protein
MIKKIIFLILLVLILLPIDIIADAYKNTQPFSIKKEFGLIKDRYKQDFVKVKNFIHRETE